MADMDQDGDEDCLVAVKSGAGGYLWNSAAEGFCFHNGVLSNDEKECMCKTGITAYLALL